MLLLPAPKTVVNDADADAVVDVDVNDDDELLLLVCCWWSMVRREGKGEEELSNKKVEKVHRQRQHFCSQGRREDKTTKD